MINENIFQLSLFIFEKRENINQEILTNAKEYAKKNDKMEAYNLIEDFEKDVKLWKKYFHLLPEQLRENILIFLLFLKNFAFLNIPKTIVQMILESMF